jgi:thiol-disulfide isomerase/thioredoxin
VAVKKLSQALIVLVVLCASGLLALTYWPRSSQGVSGQPAIGNSDASKAPQDAALGEFTPRDPPRPAPALAFTDRDGRPLALADFRGQWLLVNFWATWCAPCVREMPSLAQLQARLGDRLKVLAISEDRGGATVVEPFLEKLALHDLAIYLDPKAGAQSAMSLRGLPTSLLIDREGRIRGALEGAAEWDSPKMIELVQRYLRQDDAAGATIKTSTRR